MIRFPFFKVVAEVKTPDGIVKCMAGLYTHKPNVEKVLIDLQHEIKKVEPYGFKLGILTYPLLGAIHFDSSQMEIVRAYRRRCTPYDILRYAHICKVE